MAQSLCYELYIFDLVTCQTQTSQFFFAGAIHESWILALDGGVKLPATSKYKIANVLKSEQAENVEERQREREKCHTFSNHRGID